MARIYYNKEELCGQPIQRGNITPEVFSYIFNNTDESKFELRGIDSSALLGDAKSNGELFNYAFLTRDGIHFNAAEGSFFLPSSIIFYDIPDYNFPSEFYFIAKIGDQIELRKCSAGEGVKWFQIPQLHKPVLDSNIVLKVDTTMALVKKLVETTFNKQTVMERKKQEEKERTKIERNRPLLSDAKRNAYQALTDLCVHDATEKERISNFIETLKSYDSNIEYDMTLTNFRDFLDTGQNDFIMGLDWKAGVEELEHVLQSAIKNNYNLTIELPNQEDYEEDASISYDDVFEDFDTSLRKNGLQLGFIGADSDEYIIILHKVQDAEKVEAAINTMGHTYYEA